MERSQMVAGVFATLTVPFVITAILLLPEFTFFETATDDEQTGLIVLLGVQAAQFFFIWLWLFFSCRDDKHCPGVGKGIEILGRVSSFGVLPLAALGLSVFFGTRDSVKEGPMYAWFLIYGLL